MDDDSDYDEPTKSLTRKSSPPMDRDFNDFDDDDSGQSTRRPTFSDDGYDDNDDTVTVSVDLTAFLTKKTGEAEAAPVEVAVVEEVEGDLEEDDEEDEDEEGDEGEEEFDPSEEFRHIETLSEEQLRLQKEYSRRLAKQKKRALIREYLQNAKHLQTLRMRNTFLGLKMTSLNDQRIEIIERYKKMQTDMVENAKEAEYLKQMHLLESCKTLQRNSKKESDPKEAPKPRPKKKQHRKGHRQTRFHGDTYASTNSKVNVEPILKQSKRRDFTVDVLKSLYMKAVKNPVTQQMKGKAADTGKCQPAKPGKVVSFSFERSKFLGDVISPKKERRRKSVLMNIKINEDPPPSRDKMDPQSQSQAIETLHLAKPQLAFTAGRRKPSFHVTTEAKSFAKSKSRLALDTTEEGRRIMLDTEEVDVTDLHVFNFEFADLNLTAPHVSGKIREDSLNMLQSRHVPVAQLTWPMKVKGFGFENKNPYGRVQLTYTSLSAHEKEHPHTAYRIVLTNIAYFRAKEQRLLEVQQRNQLEMEGERQRLAAGIQQILEEVIKGLRIWAGLSGITYRERYEAKHETERFIEDLRNSFDSLVGLFAQLYKTIQSHEFALRKLAISEDKGEGAQLHEFKEIMRSREKLKAEHRAVQKFIMQYQRYSRRVLQNVRKNDKRVRAATDKVSQMSGETNKLKKKIDHLAEGIHFCQDIKLRKQGQVKSLKTELGLAAYPAVMNEYQKAITAKEDSKLRALQLRRQYNGVVRQTFSITSRNPHHHKSL